MYKLVGIFFVLASPTIAAAQQPRSLEARIATMEAKIAELSRKLEQLEKLLSQAKAREMPANEIMETRRIYRKLQRGMKPDDVRKLLGEPVRVHQFVNAKDESVYWHYRDCTGVSLGMLNPGSVSFFNGVLNAWQEP